jgi:DNA-binding NtrC family response regulator
VSGVRPARVLVVEDDGRLRRGIARALRESWEEVVEAASGEEALAALRDPGAEPFDAVLSELRLPGPDGLAVLRAARERDPRTGVVLLTARGSIEAAVEAMREGAFDFLQKPVDLEEVELRVARAVEQGHLLAEVCELRAEREARDAACEIVGESPALRAVLDLARRVAPTRSTVLLTGETGTGKEVLAALIHRLSPRRDRPLVKVNCAALPETLLESELFGHERGAFTGADRPRIGRFEQASGGTLFLDEVGDTSPATQAKLLRVLQDQEFHRLGGTRILRTDARIVAATNRDLGERVRAGLFREDLFFRLDVIRIELPPLRERTGDIATLAHRFLRDFAGQNPRPVRGFTEGALRRLRAHRWPGNVRELRNAIERAVLMAEGPRIRAEDLASCGEALGAPAAAGRGGLPAEGVDLREVQRTLVVAALERAGWVQKDAARLLGVSRRKLNYMIRRMEITHPSWRRNRPRSEPKPSEGPPGGALPPASVGALPTDAVPGPAAQRAEAERSACRPCRSAPRRSPARQPRPSAPCRRAPCQAGRAEGEGSAGRPADRRPRAPAPCPQAPCEDPP